MIWFYMRFNQINKKLYHYKVWNIKWQRKQFHEMKGTQNTIRKGYVPLDNVNVHKAYYRRFQQWEWQKKKEWKGKLSHVFDRVTGLKRLKEN